MKAQVLPTYYYSFFTTCSSQPSPSTWTSQEAGLHGDQCVPLTLCWHTVSPSPGPLLLRTGMASGGPAARFALGCSLHIPLSSGESEVGPKTWVLILELRSDLLTCCSYKAFRGRRLGWTFL